MTINNQDKVLIKPNATFINGQKIPESILSNPVYIRGTDLGGNYIISTSPSGSILGTIKQEYLYKTEIEKLIFHPYLIQITQSCSRKELPRATSKNIGSCEKGEIYTIMEISNNWGKLKLNLGWIDLQNTKKL